MNHWMILPVLIPAIVAPLLALAVRHDLVLARVFSIGSTLALLGLGIGQLWVANDGIIRTYALGNWPPPYGIVLVLDRLSALMLVLTAVVGLTVLIYSLNGWDRKGQHFHALFQFQLMGLNGAFLTGDLFNLFVFFEVLLIASYGLVVHGGGPKRMKAGIQYVSVNLIGSTIFLFGLALIYSVSGTLNMAHLAQLTPQLPEGSRGILNVGAALLLLVFALKSALFPLQFWLPATYANAPGPVAALFSIMTKVGIYSIIRVFTVALPFSSDLTSSHLSFWIMPLAVVTLIVGSIGVLGSKGLSQQISYAAIASVGTLLIAIGGMSEASFGAGIYYLIHSTLSISVLFLIGDAVLMERGSFADRLKAGPVFVGQGLLGGAFFVAAIAVAGLPPLSGFVGKLFVMQSLQQIPFWGGIWFAILACSLLVIVGFARSGSILFWNRIEETNDPIEGAWFKLILPSVAIGLSLCLVIGLTGFASPITKFTEMTASQLYSPTDYIEAVLGNEE